MGILTKLQQFKGIYAAILIHYDYFIDDINSLIKYSALSG